MAALIVYSNKVSCVNFILNNSRIKGAHLLPLHYFLKLPFQDNAKRTADKSQKVYDVGSSY